MASAVFLTDGIRMACSCVLQASTHEYRLCECWQIALALFDVMVASDRGYALEHPAVFVELLVGIGNMGEVHSAVERVLDRAKCAGMAFDDPGLAAAAMHKLAPLGAYNVCQCLVQVCICLYVVRLVLHALNHTCAGWQHCICIAITLAGHDWQCKICYGNPC